ARAPSRCTAAPARHGGGGWWLRRRLGEDREREGREAAAQAIVADLHQEGEGPLPAALEGSEGRRSLEEAARREPHPLREAVALEERPAQGSLSALGRELELVALADHRRREAPAGDGEAAVHRDVHHQDTFVPGRDGGA